MYYPIINHPTIGILIGFSWISHYKLHPFLHFGIPPFFWTPPDCYDLDDVCFFFRAKDWNKAAEESGTEELRFNLAMWGPQTL